MLNWNTFSYIFYCLHRPLPRPPCYGLNNLQFEKVLPTGATGIQSPYGAYWHSGDIGGYGGISNGVRQK